MHSLDQGHVFVAAGGVRAGFNSQGGAVLIVGREVVSAGDVAHSAAI